MPPRSLFALSLHTPTLDEPSRNALPPEWTAQCRSTCLLYAVPRMQNCAAQQPKPTGLTSSDLHVSAAPKAPMNKDPWRTRSDRSRGRCPTAECALCTAARLSLCNPQPVPPRKPKSTRHIAWYCCACPRRLDVTEQQVVVSGEAGRADQRSHVRGQVLTLTARGPPSQKTARCQRGPQL